jgi:hypothetical protein
MQGASAKGIRPNEKSYLLVIKAWVKSRDPCAVEEIKRILSQVNAISPSSTECEDDNEVRIMRPTIEWYNYFLYALAHRTSSNNPNEDAEYSLSLLNHLKAQCIKDPRLRPDCNTYKQVIAIHAKTKSFSGALTAQSLFEEMMNGVNSTATAWVPTTDVFNSLMNCWLKSGPKGARSRIEYLLRNMVELRDSGFDSAAPDLVSVNTAISAIARSQRKDSVRKAHFILKNMESMYGVKPDATSYNLVIDAYAKSRDLQGGQKAEQLLKEMEVQFCQGNREIMPNTFTYSTVIDARSNDRDSGKHAEELLDRMNQIHKLYDGAIPDTAVYNSVMNVYSIQGDKQSVNRIKAILEFMEDSFAQGNENLKPNIISYNTVLKAFAYAREDCTKDARALLERLVSRNLTDVAADAISYTTVISCYARSDLPRKAKIAENLLHQMVDIYRSGNSVCKPTIFTFNAVLNSCAYTFNPKEKMDAFTVIVSTLVLLQEFTKPDHTTYGTLLKAWCNLIPKDDERRTRIVSTVFRQCCNDGQVGNMVMHQMKYAASAELYRSLIGKEITQEVQISNLPSKWSRNVKERQGKLQTNL